MKFLAQGLTAALIATAGFAAAAPASAAPMMAPLSVTQSQAGIELAQYRPHHGGGFHNRRPVCRMEVTRTRGPFGRWIVRKVRVCR
jgi:hypothetical protein